MKILNLKCFLLFTILFAFAVRTANLVNDTSNNITKVSRKTMHVLPNVKGRMSIAKPLHSQRPYHPTIITSNRKTQANKELTSSPSTTT